MITTYKDWAAYHARLFGLHWPNEIDMVLDWARLYKKAGYTVAELVFATEEVFTAKPVGKGEQPAALKASIVAQRARLCDQSSKQERREQEANASADPETRNWFRQQLRSIGKMPSN